MLSLFRSYRSVKSLKFVRHSTKGVGKWTENISSQMKLEIEEHWKPFINETQDIDSKQDKYYVLSMFPYPSGQLHMGHVRVYTISDTIARFQRMNGKKIIHPMGWDAFGLPAENAAIERKIPPQTWTKSNIENMKSQLLNLGCFFDWEREINTSDPNYYMWTQSIFLELYKSGLVYKKEAYVNWDPVDKTVLADEQVDINGCSWRSGAKVEKQLLNQWFVKTTVFAQDLYDGLNDPILEGWRDIIQLQKHWIGECNGISVDFKLAGTNYNGIGSICIWTDKPESLLCAEFITMAPNSILDKNNLVLCEQPTFKKLSVSAENPISKKKIPIFITNEVIYPEGNEAYIGCPELNECDKLFLSKTDVTPSNDVLISNKSLEERAKISASICKIVQEKCMGVYPVSSKLKDWLISRQRFWGTPIPIVYCQNCGTVPVPEKDLPVMLPDINVIGKNVTSHVLKSENWINTFCPQCGSKAIRETDTMDTFVDSSWYFLRYIDSKNPKAPFDTEKAFKNTPVDLYIGGKEHAVLHLYYARFMMHFLYSIGKVPEKEPFRKLLVQGMVMGKSFQVKESGMYIPESEVNIIDEKKGIAVTQKDNKPVTIQWEKMSKSKYNGVEPSKLFEEYGCDTTRLFILGDVAPTSSRNWSSATFPGILNWQKRLWLTIDMFIQNRNIKLDSEEKKKILNSVQFLKYEETLKDMLNYFISRTTFVYNFTHQLSVGISRLQGLTNSLRTTPKEFIGLSKEFQRALACQIIMLSPMAPHFASELWAGFTSVCDPTHSYNELFDFNKNVLQQRWPVIDSDYQLSLVCKINGNEVGQIQMLPSDLNQLTHEKALEYIFKDKVGKKVKTKAVVSSNLQVFPNCRAILSFKMNYNNEKTAIKKIN